MFIRKKSNKSGSISIQIIDKSTGRYKVIKTIGSSKDLKQVKRLEIKARNFLIGNQLTLFKTPEEKIVENFLQDFSNSQIHTIGPEYIPPTNTDDTKTIILKMDSEQEILKRIVHDDWVS